MTDAQMIFALFDNQTFGPCNGLEPRDWQNECTRKYQESVADWESTRPPPDGPHLFTIHAGTASGKTKAAGILAAFLLNSKRVEQVVFVCPNRSIRSKTRKDMLQFLGIDLTVFKKLKHANGIPRMQQGYILTYGALMADPTLHRRLCQATRVPGARMPSKPSARSPTSSP